VEKAAELGWVEMSTTTPCDTSEGDREYRFAGLIEQIIVGFLVGSNLSIEG